MKDQKKAGSNPQANKNQSAPANKAAEVNTGKPTGTEKNPDAKKTAETKTKGEDVWKNPDPTTPERKNDPDPTKPEKQEGPFGNDTLKKNPAPKKNPARTEMKDDEEIGSLEEQDIDDQGITGEANDDNDFSDEDVDHRKSA